MFDSINVSSNINSEWEQFMETGLCDNKCNKKNIEKKIPKCSDIYISTKTKIVYLNNSLDLTDLFWKIKLIDYNEYNNGVVKKQMKINSKSMEEITKVDALLKEYNYSSSHIIQSINNPEGRIKFKDIRKVSIGICKKDLINYRTKEKGAFYNCFVIIIRVKLNNIFNEYHIKLFNTGKIEIPGIKSDLELDLIMDNLFIELQKYISTPLSINKSKTETVLINSNFDCGYYLNRDILFKVLKTEYGIQSVFDPCSYPGIQCRIFFDKDYNLLNEESDGGRVSFMIFRTGSVLIVGKCDMIVLNKIYEYIKKILSDSYDKIYESEKVYENKTIIKKKIKRKILITKTN